MDESNKPIEEEVEKTDEGMQADPATKKSKAKSRRSTKTETSEQKIRLVLNVMESHPLAHFLNEIKSRGIKNFDLSNFLLESLQSKDKDWWDEKLEDLTPLEFKISEALTNPQMREKLTALLSSVNINNPTDSSSLHS